MVGGGQDLRNTRRPSLPPGPPVVHGALFSLGISLLGEMAVVPPFIPYFKLMYVGSKQGRDFSLAQAGLGKVLCTEQALHSGGRQEGGRLGVSAWLRWLASHGCSEPRPLWL